MRWKYRLAVVFGLLTACGGSLAYWVVFGSVAPPPPVDPPVCVVGDAQLTQEQFVALCESGKAVDVLEASLKRYDCEVRSYTTTMHKQERIGDKTHAPEVVDVTFRGEPYSVLFRWQSGGRSTNRSLYVAGENGNRVLVRKFNMNFPLDPAGALATGESRYPITEFGFRAATKRTYTVWKQRQDEGRLKVELLGLQTLPELGDRPAYGFKRHTDAPEEEGLREVTVWVDPTNWLQVGSKLLDGEGKLIGSYYFRNIVLNPTLPDDAFAPGQLGK